MVNFHKEKISLQSLEDVLKIHMLIKSYELGYNLSMADINTLYELYQTGYNSDFYKNCLDKQFFKSEQTVRNSIGRMTKLGILICKKRGDREIDSKFLPNLKESSTLIIQYLIGNLK